MKAATPKPCEPLYAPVDESGNIVFTCLSTLPHEAIEMFMDTERSIHALFKSGVPPSWEQYEADGYRVIPCSVIPHPTLQAEHTCQKSFDA